MSSPSSLLLPENGEDWPIRMFVLVTPWAWPAPTANTQASAPTAEVHARIIVIALSPRYGENRPLKYRHSCLFWKLPPVSGRTRVRKAQLDTSHESSGSFVGMPLDPLILDQAQSQRTGHVAATPGWADATPVTDR